MQRLKYPCIFLVALTVGCLSEEPSGLAPAHVASTTVAMDFYNKPIPTIPLPNNIATRFDATSSTKRRINASMVAPTKMESHVRKLLNELDGWGAFQPITIPFTGPLDVRSIMEGHQDPYYELQRRRVFGKY